jgi:hypothetical protein
MKGWTIRLLGAAIPVALGAAMLRVIDLPLAVGSRSCADEPIVGLRSCSQD